MDSKLAGGYPNKKMWGRGRSRHINEQSGVAHQISILLQSQLHEHRELHTRAMDPDISPTEIRWN